MPGLSGSQTANTSSQYLILIGTHNLVFCFSHTRGLFNYKWNCREFFHIKAHNPEMRLVRSFQAHNGCFERENNVLFYNISRYDFDLVTIFKRLMSCQGTIVAEVHG